MLGRGVVLLVALVGCGVPERGSPDAAIDEALIPFTTTGMTPAGSLDEIRFIGVYFYDGFCPRNVRVDLYRTNERYEDPMVSFSVPMPPLESMEPPIGTIDATAEVPPSLEIMDPASFEVVHVDLPPTDPLRTAGRMTASTNGWQVDFSFDLETVHHTCF